MAKKSDVTMVATFCQVCFSKKPEIFMSRDDFALNILREILSSHIT